MSESEGSHTSETAGTAAGELADGPDTSPPGMHPVHHVSRFSLIWAVLLFQVKLLADGFRDLLLSPLSFGAAILGLIFGGKEPDRYFRRLLRFGRKTDLLINLFGQHHHGTTAEKLVQPLERRNAEEYDKGGWLSRSADRLNRTLDQVNKNIETPTPSQSDCETPLKK